MARPTKYNPKMCKQVKKLYLLGATDAEVADFLEINRDTLYAWKNKYPAFSDTEKGAKILADAKVSESLYKRALGFSHKAVKIFNAGGLPLIVPYTQRYPPDVIACLFWLKNRRSKVDPADGIAWKDRQEMGHQFEKLNDQQLQDMVDRLTEQVRNSSNPQKSITNEQ